MLGPEWIVANVHLAYEYRARYIGGSVSSACSGDLLTLLELLKSEPLAAMGSCPLGAPRPGRIVAVSPRRWWDAEGGEAAFPHASVVGLQSSRRGVPIDIFPSLGPASPWLIFKLRWQAATGLALPESAQEASVGLNTPAPMLPEPTPYDCPRPLLAYTPNQCPTAGETVPICLTADESAGPVTVELHRLHSWCSEVGLHTQRIECPTVDSVQLSPWRQPPVCGSYGSARITINHRSSAPMVCTNQIDRPTSLMSLINAGDGLTIVVTVWPTAPRKTAVQESVQTYFAKDSTQVLMSIGDGASAVSLVLTPLGSAALRVGKQVVANTKVALAPREWCTIAASLTDTTATLVQKPLSLMAEPICVRETWRGCAGAALVMVAIEEEAADQNWNRQKLEAEHSEEPGRRDHELETLVMFAAAMGEHGPCEHYNGKLSSPALWAVGLDVGTALAYRKRQQYGELPPRPEEALGMTGLIATWDFSLALSLSPACGEQATVPGQRKRQQQEQQLVLDNGANMVVDVGPNGHHGELYNCPARGVTGPRWAAAALAGDTNAEQSWQHSALHDAVHFHEDDVGDFGWSSDFSIDTTALESGVYGVRLEQGRWHDWVSFFVRRPPLQASAHGDRTAREAEGASPPVVFLAPTASYLAYACNTFAAQEGAELAGGGAGTGFIDATYCFLHSNPYYGFSCYDLHADGSGVAYMSLLRPQFLMHRGDLAGQFEDDSRLVSFLTHKSIDHDVVTDTHLHCDGVACLAAYRCVITGTHPEYYSSKMLAAVQEFTSTGGRLLYLGANGFYWHIAFEEDGSSSGCSGSCQRMETRRAEGGMRSWLASDGEYFCSYSGELGGLWRRKGMPPQTVAGVGFTAQGFDSCTDYRVEPQSEDPRARFIFAGVPQRVGDRFGQGGHRGGAAGLEIDRADASLGTPKHALRVACADAFPHSYKRVGEEAGHAHSANTGLMDPLIRADVVFYEVAGGGAVFATGSIAWASNLPEDGYDGTIARITANVIERFASHVPFEPPPIPRI